jgi:hypothetical protein
MQSSTYKVVCVRDPGIDTPRMEWSQMIDYVRSREFSKVEPFVNMQKTTVFSCREVPASLWESFVMAGDSDSEMFRRAFACGVVNVHNLRNEDGTVVPWAPTGALRGQSGVMTEEELARFYPAVRSEIGSVIFHRSFLDPWTERIFPLQPTLLTQLTHRTFRSADASQSGAAQSSEKPSEATTPNQAPTGNG